MIGSSGDLNFTDRCIAGAKSSIKVGVYTSNTDKFLCIKAGVDIFI